eukprot:jgi/Mesen1/6826/ME000035S06196
MDKKVSRRTALLARHLTEVHTSLGLDVLEKESCLQYMPPESHSGKPAFDIGAMRALLDGDGAATYDSMFALFAANEVFWPKDARKERLYTSMDYNSTKEEQREITMQRILFLRDRGYLKGYLTDNSIENIRRVSYMHDALSIYDHSLSIKLGVHMNLWGGAIKYLGTKRHHDKWLKKTEDYEVAGCFGLTELGHGSNVRGIETVATYDTARQEFVISTPCETAQKYWIGGAAQHATHCVAFAQLLIGGKSEGVHAFIVQLREGGRVCAGIRIADCGHKIGLNGVDNGRIWFDDVRIPRENLLNAVADVTPDGRYESSIQDADQRFGAFMAPLTGGRVTIAQGAVSQCKVGLGVAMRYALSRRAFSMVPGEPEVLILDYPSHQRRLLPLLAKTYAMGFAVNELKELYVRRKPSDSKVIHVQSSGYKAMASWHMLRTLQECREACGGMGIRSDNRIGQLKAEHDVMATFEGDNNVLMQQVSKAMLADYMGAQRRGKPLKGMGLEHMNEACPSLPSTFDRSTLRSSNVQLNLFRLRERNLLERLARHVASLQQSGRSLAEASNESYQLAADLGEAHAEREVLEAIHAVAQQQRSIPGTLQHVLGLLQSLYVWTSVDENAVFLRYGYVTPEQAQAVQKEVVALCSELRPHALALLDSTGIAPHLLGPIAHDWVEFNSYKNEERAARSSRSWSNQTLDA